MKNYYEILGVDITATQEEIRKAYYKQARKYHPDNNPGQDTTNMMQQITLAYNTLSNEESKKQYDATLKRNQSRTSFNNTTTNTNNSYSHTQSTEDFWRFFDEYFHERSEQTQQEERRKQNQRKYEKNHRQAQERAKRAQRKQEERIRKAQQERQERIRRAQQEREEILRQVQQEREEILRQVRQEREEILRQVQQEREEISRQVQEELNQQKEFFKNLNFEYHTMNNLEEMLGVQNKINAFEKIKKKIFKK